MIGSLLPTDRLSLPSAFLRRPSPHKRRDKIGRKYRFSDTTIPFTSKTNRVKKAPGGQRVTDMGIAVDKVSEGDRFVLQAHRLRSTSFPSTLGSSSELATCVICNTGTWKRVCICNNGFGPTVDENHLHSYADDSPHASMPSPWPCRIKNSPSEAAHSSSFLAVNPPKG